MFSCLTCSPESKNDLTKAAGICLACSYHCHENHELVELYTKRNFRCDCGGSRMNNVHCKLDPYKINENDKNAYNQNFSGLYCTCHRPYPDPEDTVQDEMIQCIICEDWYHSRHLDATVPMSHNFVEMICGTCIADKDFLKYYTGYCVETVKEEACAENIEVTEIKTETKNSVNDDPISEEINQCLQDIINVNKRKENSDDVVDIKVEENLEAKNTEPPSKKIKLDNAGTSSDCPDEKSDICKKPLKNTYKKGATFWPADWRNKLCQCSVCLKMYKDLSVAYLLDLNDTVQSYEENGKKKNKATDYERGMQALSRLDRVQQVDAITEYNKMKDKLKEYLHTFVVNNQVVTEEDINTFFRTMKNEKNENLGQPYSCR